MAVHPDLGMSDPTSAPTMRRSGGLEDDIAAAHLTTGSADRIDGSLQSNDRGGLKELPGHEFGHDADGHRLRREPGGVGAGGEVNGKTDPGDERRRRSRTERLVLRAGHIFERVDVATGGAAGRAAGLSEMAFSHR